MSFYYVNNIEKIGENMYSLEVMDSSITPHIPDIVEVMMTRDDLLKQFTTGNLHDMNGKWLRTKQTANKYLKDFEV